MHGRLALIVLLVGASSCARYGYAPRGDAPRGDAPRASDTRPREASAPAEGAPPTDAARDTLRRDLFADARATDRAGDLPAPLGAPWSKRFGGPAFDSGYAVAVDKSRNIVVTGPFNGPIDFGGGPLSSAGGMDCYLASFDQNGNHRWSKRFGTSTEDYADGVAVDGSGNIAIAGVFDGSVSFGGPVLVSAGAYDGFLASYTSAGAHRWSRRFGSTSFDSAYGVAFDASGNVFVTGEFYGSADFGGGAVTIGAGGADIFLASYTSSGAYRWAKSFGSGGSESGWGIAVDGAGNVTIGGVAEGTVNFGGGLLSTGVFLASFTGGGAHRWSKAFTGSAYVRGMAADATGNVAVTGAFSATMVLGANVASVGGYDAYVASFDANGASRWVKTYGSTGSDIGWGVATDGSGNVTITGEYSGAVTFPNGTMPCVGGSDIMIVSLSSSGGFRWAKTFGSSVDDYGHGVAAEPNGQLTVTGKFSNTVDFGQGPLTAGGQDVMLLRLMP
jgi:hypothetical protein